MSTSTRAPEQGEPPAHPLHEGVFLGETIRVMSANRIDSNIDLDFGFVTRKLIQLVDFDTRSFGSEVFERAKHCLIVLVGSRKTVIRPDPATRRQWYAMSVIRARVYIDVPKLKHTPVGWTMDTPGTHRPSLEVSAFMCSLRTSGFDAERVRAMLNGRD